MRICIVTTEYPMQGRTGGIATYTQSSARWLVTKGHSVEVFCPTSESTERSEEQDGVIVHFVKPLRLRLQRALKLLGGLTNFRFFSEAVAGWHLLENSIGVWRAINRRSRDQRFDIIEFPDTFGLGYWTTRLPFRRVPVIIRSHATLRAFGLTREWPGAFFQSKLEDYSIAHADFVLTCSLERIESYCQWFDLEDSRIACVYTGIDTDHFKPMLVEESEEHGLNQEIRLLFIGRIELAKGCDVLIDALRVAFEQVPQAKVTFLGHVSEEMHDLLRRFALDYAGRTIHQEWVAPEQVLCFLQASDILILPSRWETLSRVLIEALAVGVPQIGTRIMGIPEVIDHGTTGYLVDLEIRDLAEAIIKLCVSPDVRREMSKNSRKRALQLFAIDIVMEKQVEAYKRVIAEWHVHRNRQLSDNSLQS